MATVPTLAVSHAVFPAIATSPMMLPVATMAPQIVPPAPTSQNVLPMFHTTAKAPLISIPLTSNSQTFNSDTSGSQGTLITGNAFYQKPSGALSGDPNKDPERKKRDREIDAKRKGVFLIDSEAFKTAKSRTRGNMRCGVERFEIGTDLNFKDWINQMESYFTIGQVPADAFVGCMLMKIVPKHLNKIKRYQTLDYLAFLAKLVKVFEDPDMATAHLTALSNFSQTIEESISEYMLRARLLALKGHPDLDHLLR